MQNDEAIVYTHTHFKCVIYDYRDILLESRQRCAEGGTFVSIGGLN